MVGEQQQAAARLQSQVAEGKSNKTRNAAQTKERPTKQLGEGKTGKQVSIPVPFRHNYHRRDSGLSFLAMARPNPAHPPPECGITGVYISLHPGTSIR